MKRIVMVLIAVIIACTLILIVKTNNSKNNVNNESLYEISSNNETLTNQQEDIEILNDEELEKQNEEAKKQKQETIKRQQEEKEKAKQDALNQRQEVLNKEKNNNSNIASNNKNTNIQDKTNNANNITTNPNPSNNTTTNFLDNYIKVEESTIKGYLLKSEMYCIYELANGSVWLQPTTKEVIYMGNNLDVTVYANKIMNYFLQIEGSEELIPVVKPTYTISEMIYPQRLIQPLQTLIAKGGGFSSNNHSVIRLKNQIKDIQSNWRRAKQNQIYCLANGENWKQVSNKSFTPIDTHVIICEYGGLYIMKLSCSYENGIVTVLPYTIE